MKKTIYSFLMALTVMTLAISCNKGGESSENQEITENVEAVEYTVDPSASSVQWRGDMVKMYYHEGTVALKEGNLNIANGQLSGGKFVVDMTQIVPTDSNYSPDRPKENLVGHLSSPEFFDVANHKEATFEITSVNGNEAKGTLTLRGKSNEETIRDIVITENGDQVSASGKLTFDRKKYDVSFDMTVKDMVLSNDIQLTIQLNGKKK